MLECLSCYTGLNPVKVTEAIFAWYMWIFLDDNWKMVLVSANGRWYQMLSSSCTTVVTIAFAFKSIETVGIVSKSWTCMRIYDLCTMQPEKNCLLLYSIKFKSLVFVYCLGSEAWAILPMLWFTIWGQPISSKLWWWEEDQKWNNGSLQSASKAHSTALLILNPILSCTSKFCFRPIILGKRLWRRLMAGRSSSKLE